MSRRKTLVRTLELAAAAPQVIALRTAGMLAAGHSPTARDRREMTRMVSEKVGAFSESWWAMATRQQQLAIDAWMAAAQGAWKAWLQPWTMQPFNFSSMQRELNASQRRLQRAQDAVMAGGLAPLHRAATANLRRLSRRSR